MARSFEELDAYQAARAFRVRICRLTRLLPAHEKNVLRLQMRRAALSLTNCIAEGHGSRSYRHNRSYLYRSRGSLQELCDDLNMCEDEDYFPKVQLDDLRKDAERVAMLINGYIGYLSRCIAAGKTQEEKE